VHGVEAAAIEIRFYSHKLEAITLATPGIYKFSFVRHLTLLNKSAKQIQISRSTVSQPCSDATAAAAASDKKAYAMSTSRACARKWSVARGVATHGPVLHMRMQSAVGT
jgi:hypothetical protein